MSGERISAATASGQTRATPSADSRPSENNPSAPQSGAGADEKEADLSQRRRWWRRKNDRVDEMLDRWPDRAARPISVKEGTKIRDDVAAERSNVGLDDQYRSSTWSDTLRAFLGWYNGYRYAHLRFRDPDGELVRAPMLNSHQPKYGDRYYHKLKALERQAVEQFDNLHVALLTFTGSHRNENGGWRCPADHIREVVEPFGENVRPALHRALGSNGADVDRWEYCKVLEHHKSGYGHMHVAVFVDGDVSEEDFRPAIDAHVEHCEIADAAAHDYHHPEEEKRPISVSRVDADLDPAQYEEAENVVGNLASYVAEYIGAHGEELLDRDLAEITFRAATWATTTHRVDFSGGAAELIEQDGADPDGDDLDDDLDSEDPDATPDVSDTQLAEDPTEQWELDGLGRVDEDGEDVFEMDHSAVQYREIDGHEHLDPPPSKPSDPPRPKTRDTSLTEW